MEIKADQWNWKPLISVGSIKFGELAEPIIQKFELQKLEKPFEEFDSDSYEFSNCNTRIYVEDARIDSVGCFDNIYYEGENLFGLTLEEIRKRLGKEDEIGEAMFFDGDNEESKQIPVEFEKWGLQLWLKCGSVECAMVRGSYEDD